MSRSTPTPRLSFGIVLNNTWISLRATDADGAVREAETEHGPRAGDYVECSTTGAVVKRYGKNHGFHARVNKYNDRRRGRAVDSPRTQARKESLFG